MKLDEEGKLSCTCNMVTTRGFPCRHIWKVNCHLDKNDLTLIPIVSRWTINYGSQIQKALAVCKEIKSAKYEESKESYPTKTEEALNLQMSSIKSEKTKIGIRQPRRKISKKKGKPCGGRRKRFPKVRQNKITSNTTVTKNEYQFLIVDTHIYV